MALIVYLRNHLYDKAFMPSSGIIPGGSLLGDTIQSHSIKTFELFGDRDGLTLLKVGLLHMNPNNGRIVVKSLYLLFLASLGSSWTLTIVNVLLSK